jgi:hypothetical protein
MRNDLSSNFDDLGVEPILLISNLNVPYHSLLLFSL